LPKGANTIEIVRQIGGEKPVSADEMKSWGVRRRIPVKIIYDMRLKGTTIWYAVRYQNDKGEFSMWSEIRGELVV
jgi:hypothetical protein